MCPWRRNGGIRIINGYVGIMSKHEYVIRNVGFCILIVILAGCGKVKLVKADKIYPYVVPDAYLQYQPTHPQGVSKSLGHGLSVVLVQDLDGLVGDVKNKDLSAMNLTVEQAYNTAVGNLEVLAKSGKIDIQFFPNGPQGKPFMLFGGHWSAATCILLPKLKEMAANNLGTADVCICVPHREAMIMFQKGDRTYRDAMRAMIKEKESDGSKPLTYELFTFGNSGVVPFQEDQPTTESERIE